MRSLNWFLCRLEPFLEIEETHRFFVAVIFRKFFFASFFSKRRRFYSQRSVRHSDSGPNLLKGVFAFIGLFVALLDEVVDLDNLVESLFDHS